MIPGDLLSAFPHRQFHTLPGLLDSWAALPNSNPNACMPMQGGSLYHFCDGLWYDPAERRTHDLPCERRTRYRLSQPDTVSELNTPHQLSLFFSARIPRRPYVALGNLTVEPRVFPHYKVPLTFYIYENHQENIAQKFWKNSKFLMLLFRSIHYVMKKT